MKHKFVLSLIVFLIFAADLSLIYFVKYNINSVPLSDFEIFNLGNLLLSLFNLFSMILLIIYIYRNRNLKKFPGIIVSLLALQILFLIPAVIILIYNIDVPDYNYSTYSLKKMLTVGLMIISKLIHLYLIISVWNSLLSGKKISYLRSAFSTLVAVAVILLLAIGYTSIFTGNQLDDTNSDSYDIVVVLGAAVWSDNKPSPIFTGRIEKAAQLYRSGRINSIQLTGGSAPGEKSEARAAYDLLLELGVDEELLQLEEETSTTSEQIRFIKNSLLRNDENLSIAIISDTFHLKRVLEMCSFFHVPAKGIASDYRINFEKLLFYKLRDSIGLLLFWIFAI